MPNATYVTAGKPKVGGALYRAALGTTLPTNATATLAGGFVDLGYISDDGITNSNTIESDDVKAWGGDTVLSLQTDKTDTFSFTMLEVMNDGVLKAVFGDSNVSGTLASGLTINVNADEQKAASWVIEMVLNGVDAKKRIVIPNGKITEIGDVVYSDSEAVGYEVTITAIPDTNGNTHYEYVVVTGATGATGET